MKNSLYDDYGVITREGKQYLTYRGEILPNQVKTVVLQDPSHCGETPAVCEVTLTVIAVLNDSKPL